MLFLFQLAVFWPAAGSCAATPDPHEDDNSYERASLLLLEAEPQQHNFHNTRDQDWFQFYGIAGRAYTIRLSNAGKRCDAVLRLYDTDAVRCLKEEDDDGNGGPETLTWPCSKSGGYFLRISQAHPSSAYGVDTEYDVELKLGAAGFDGIVQGFVKDRLSLAPLSNAYIQTDGGATATTGKTGVYALIDTAGDYVLTANVEGYKPLRKTIQIEELQTDRLDLELTRIDAPDLWIEKIAAPAKAAVGDNILLKVYVKNTGTKRAGASTVALYLSPAKTITQERTLLGSMVITALPPGGGGWFSVSTEVAEDILAGKYFLHAVADSARVVKESIESNNTRFASRKVEVVR